MPKNSDYEYLEALRTLESGASQYVSNLNLENQENYSYYFREQFGDEKPYESKAVSSDCFDVVESDMPSIIRTFLSGGDIEEFVPTNEDDEKQVLEAKQKTKYINRLVLDGNFPTLYEWFKAAEISNYSVLTYYVEETEAPEVVIKEGISELELELFLNSLEESDDVSSVEITEEERYDDVFEVELKVKRKTQKYVIEWVPEESFKMSPARSIEDSAYVGHSSEVTKGDLVAQFPGKRKEIKALGQRALLGDDNISDIKEQQISQTSGENDVTSQPDWFSQTVVVDMACVRYDRDGDGYAERRRVVMVEDLILEDEAFDHVNYALLSCYPIPGKAVGKSRVAITKETQRQKSLIQRGMFNNIAMVNKPMVGINTDPDRGSIANKDDLLNRRTNGIVRCKGSPVEAMYPIPTEYIGQQSLEIIQYLDFQRAQTTGALMASQGLSKDNIYAGNETATRFNGVSDEGAAKLELIMRVFAETGVKKLYEGMAWLAQNYQNSDVEVKIMGEQIVFDPTSWRYDNICKPRVGLAAADTEELKMNLSAILQILQGLQAAGSTISDESKIYNTLSKLLNNMGVYDVSEYLNDPAVPAETAQAQLEQSKKLIAQLQQQVQQNPLAEAEQVKAQARLIEAQAKDQTDRDKAMSNRQQFEREMEFKEREARAKYGLQVTELELKYNKELPGGLDDE